MDDIAGKIQAYRTLLGQVAGADIPLQQKVAGLHRMLGDISKDIVRLQARKTNMAQSHMFGGPDVQDAQVDQLRQIQSSINQSLERLEPQLKEREASSQSAEPIEPLLQIAKLCSRFHLVARQLRSRRENRSTLEVEDEYDVQDLLHALLRLDFDDIRTEEWAPSYAGGTARMDFLLKQEQIAVETKMMRTSLSERDLGEQLIIDARKYREHPHCKTLFCFIYDPNGKLENPRGIEDDLHDISDDDLLIVALVRPK